MFRLHTLILSLLLFCPIGLDQAPPTTSESTTLQAMLTEIRQLRQDLLASAIAARRAQIVIYRLYSQEAAVIRATQRLDDAKSELTQLQDRKKYFELQKKQYEQMRDRAENPAQQKQFEDSVASFAVQIEALTPVEQEAQNKAGELEQQWRIEQAKLEQLRDELDRIDRAVVNASLRSSAAQRE